MASRFSVAAIASSLFVFAAACTGSANDVLVGQPPVATATAAEPATGAATEDTTAPESETSEPPCLTVRPGDDAQSIINDAGPNREICFEAGRYENFSVTPLSGQRLMAAEGTIVDGGGTNAAAFSTTADTKADDVLIDGFEITGYVSGESCANYRSDCGEAPVRGGAVFPHLTLDAEQVPDVIVESQTSLRWTLRNSHIHDNLGTGVSVGEAMIVENNIIERNSHLGIGGGTVGGISIVGNQIGGNSYDEGIPSYWEAGQIKLGYINNSSISNNTFTGGVGPAIWCDVQCSDVTIADNNITNIDSGLAVGIFYEISRTGTITGNTVSNITGQCNLGPADGAGILVSESQQVSISNNTVTDSDSFVIVQQLDRNRFQGDLDHLQVTVSPDTDPLWRTESVSVTNNSFTSTTENCSKSPGGRVGLSVLDAGANANTENVDAEVTFAGNDYLGTEDAVAFFWPTADESIDWLQWSGLGLQ